MLAKQLMGVFVGRTNKILIFKDHFCGAVGLRMKSCLSRHGSIGFV